MSFFPKKQSDLISKIELNIQIFLFVILYGIWGLPETILIRNICLVVGALISVHKIYQNRNSLIRFMPVPTWLIICLFIW